MDIETRLELIKRNTAEILTETELRAALETGIPLRHYIGFEISGPIHLGTGLVCMSKVRDFQRAKASCSLFLADWHSWINEKLGGDLETIQRVAKAYFAEGLKACLEALGGNSEKIKVVLGSKLYHANDDYWRTVIDIAKHSTLGRVKRSITILGREAREKVNFAMLIYPVMQVADIFAQGINLAHAGLDQRKAHVIARDVALKLRTPLRHKGRPFKPIAVHHPLLLGLQTPPIWPIPTDRLRQLWTAQKMSKSVPGSAIAITDSPDEIKAKLGAAFCPARETAFNPVLNWVKALVFAEPGAELEIVREKRWGGPISFSSYADLEAAFAAGQLHPLDLKAALADFLIKVLEPVRKAFSRPALARAARELAELTR